ncbi:hypothetical protein JCM12294_05520 [Desulfocicer niacini]
MDVTITLTNLEQCRFYEHPLNDPQGGHHALQSKTLVNNVVHASAAHGMQ